MTGFVVVAVYVALGLMLLLATALLVAAIYFDLSCDPPHEDDEDYTWEDYWEVR